MILRSGLRCQLSVGSTDIPEGSTFSSRRKVSNLTEIPTKKQRLFLKMVFMMRFFYAEVTCENHCRTNHRSTKRTLVLLDKMMALHVFRTKKQITLL